MDITGSRVMKSSTDHYIGSIVAYIARIVCRKIDIVFPSVTLTPLVPYFLTKNWFPFHKEGLVVLALLLQTLLGYPAPCALLKHTSGSCYFDIISPTGHAKNWCWFLYLYWMN